MAVSRSRSLVPRNGGDAIHQASLNLPVPEQKSLFVKACTRARMLECWFGQHKLSMHMQTIAIHVDGLRNFKEEFTQYNTAEFIICKNGIHSNVSLASRTITHLTRGRLQ